MRPRKQLKYSCRVAVVTLAFFAQAAWAQEPASPAPEMPLAPQAEKAPAPQPADQLVEFGKFLDQNPALDARLREDTSLLGNAAFLKNHPQIDQYLQAHPSLHSELAANPRWFPRREFLRIATPVTPEKLAGFDRLLDNNPDLAKQLAAAPQLLTQPEYVGSHAALQQFFKANPELKRSAAAPAARPTMRTSPGTTGKRTIIRRGNPKGR